MLEDLPIIIQGERIHLAKPEVSFDFAKKMFAVVDVNREHILPWLEWATFERTKSAEDEFAFALDADNSWRDGSRFEFAIYSNDTKDYLGGISLIKRGKTVCKGLREAFRRGESFSSAHGAYRPSHPPRHKRTLRTRNI